MRTGRSSLPGRGASRQRARSGGQALWTDGEQHLTPRPPTGDKASLLKNSQMLCYRLPGDGQHRRQSARTSTGITRQEFKQLTPACVRESGEYAVRVSESFCHNRPNASHPRRPRHCLGSFHASHFARPRLQDQRSALLRRPASSYRQPPLLPFHSFSRSASGRSSDANPLSTSVTPSSSPTGRR